jgi:hypothetical protein
LKNQLVQVFEANDMKTAKTVSQVMSTVMLRGGFNIWPELLSFLTKNIDVASLGVDEEINAQILEKMAISIHTIAIIVEDCSKLFEDNKFRNVIS